MLDDVKLQQWNQWMQTLSTEELTWIHGYIAGKLSTVTQSATQLAVNNSVTTTKKITIAYGTETGNSKKVATDLATKAKQKGIQTKVVALDQYRLTDLPKEEYFFTVISTQGEGEPPEAAKKFYDHIHQNGFKVPNMKYGVLALGDTSYPLYCKTGEDVDIQLQKLGGNRIVPLQKCDVDYETDANKWFDAVINSLFTADSTNTAVVEAPKPVVTEKKPGKKIYEATVLTNINLTATGSTKKTYHLELGADEIDYLPGDSIAINPENEPEIVNEIIAITNIDGNKTITWKSETTTVKELLLNKINIRYLLEKAVKQYITIAGNNEIPTTRTDLIDLLRKYPLNATQFEEFLGSLSFIAPRIYNIASSPAAHGSEVHIIALQDTFLEGENIRKGLCTTYFESKKEGDTIPFFVQPNKRFRLPAADKDIIMIGPGTGIAPFRSFVAERDAVGATGKNWLFFGEENFTTDFYYQTEWQNWFNTGVLTKISLAFANSRKEQPKVENKLLQQATTLFEWIQNGAYIYLCGEKDPMSKAVENTLLHIFSTIGNMDEDAAKKYFEQLKTEGRYMKDVY